MPESLLTILKFCFLALLYLFFFRVLRAVWAEIRPVAATAPASPRPKAKPRDRSPRTGPPTKLRIVEPNLDECVHCELCFQAGPGGVRVVDARE